MIIKVRTLQGLQKEVDVAIGETVETLKRKVQEAFPELDSSKQKIIYGGKILEDATVVSNTLQEKDAVIVMVNRQHTFKRTSGKETEVAADKKDSNNEPSHINTIASTTAATTSTTAAATNSAREEATATVTAAVADTTTNVTESISGNAEHVSEESRMLIGDNLLSTINNICHMGFERDQVERAMHAAYNNPSRAIDYLTNGFPESDVEQRNANASVNENTGVNDNAENYEDEEYEEVMQHDENNVVDALEEVNGDSALPSDILEFASDEQARQLLNNPNFINFLRNVAVGSPQRISDVLELIGRTDPELLNYIRENHDQITYIMQQFLNSHTSADGMGSSDDSFTVENYEELQDQLADAFGDQRSARDITEQQEGAYLAPSTISLTEKEIESVNKLEALGFPKHVALEAFIACDKNEELAANYLFENMEDEGAS